MGKLTDKQGYICDMDGVIYHGDRLVEGTKEFVDWLKEKGKRFLFLTNSSAKSPKELKQKLSRMGIETALVLSGITKRADLELFPYQPDHVLNCVADIIRGN